MKYFKILSTILISFLLVNLSGCINISENEIVENNTVTEEEKIYNQSIDESFNKSSNESIDESSDKSSNTSADESYEEPVSKPSNESSKSSDESVNKSSNEIITNLDDDEKKSVDEIQQHISELIGCDLVFNGTRSKLPIFNPYGYHFNFDEFHIFQIKNPIRDDWEVMFYYNITTDSLYMELLKPYTDNSYYEHKILLKCYENNFTIVSGVTDSNFWSLEDLYPEDVNKIEVIVNDVISSYNGKAEFTTYGELAIKYPYFIETESQEEAIAMNDLSGYEKINVYEIKQQISKTLDCEPVFTGVSYNLENQSSDIDKFYTFKIKSPVKDDYEILFYYNINVDVLFLYLVKPYEGVVNDESEYKNTILFISHGKNLFLSSVTNEGLTWSSYSDEDPPISENDIKLIVDDILSDYNGTSELSFKIPLYLR